MTALEDAQAALAAVENAHRELDHAVAYLDHLVTELQPPAPPPAPSWPRYGVSHGYTIIQRSDAMQQWELERTVEVGAQVSRLDWPMGDTSGAERAIAKAHALGLKVSLGIGDTLKAATSISAATYAGKAGAVAAKYRDTGIIFAYELGNEPNGSWNGPWNPATYMSYHKAARQAILAADPAARVIMAGIAPAASVAPVAWAGQLYGNGLKGQTAAMNVHGYGDPFITASWSIHQQTFGPNVVPNIVGVMAQNGELALPIISTESGDQVGKVTEDVQALTVSRVLADARYAMVFVYDMLDTVPGYGMMVRDAAGPISAPDGSRWRKRKSFAAYQTVAKG